jgi:peptide/nickel transport system permease protein
VAVIDAHVGVNRLGGRRRAFLLRRLSPGAIVSLLVFLVLCVPLIVPDWLAPYDPTAVSPNEIFQQPSIHHWLGTDQYGRDMLSRLIYGTRISMSLGVVSVSLSVLISLPLGVASGYYRGMLDSVLMRLMDVVMAFPGILLALIIIAIIGPGLANAMIAVGIGEAPAYTRVVRSATLSVREQSYIEAARATGAHDIRILLRYVLPNVIQPLIIISSVGFAVAIVIGSSLGFLGLGAQPPTAEWGTMVSEGRTYLRSQWWISAFPGATIGITVLALNIIGDALRDVFDPRLRRGD